jgi:hypothetical protein
VINADSIATSLLQNARASEAIPTIETLAGADRSGIRTRAAPASDARQLIADLLTLKGLQDSGRLPRVNFSRYGMIQDASKTESVWQTLIFVAC